MTYTRTLDMTGHRTCAGPAGKKSEKPDWMQPRRYIGIRISDVESKGDAWVVKQFESAGFPNPYFYGFHSPDSGCKVRHAHFVLLRDYDPTATDDTKSKKIRREYIKNTELSGKGNAYFAISFFSNSVVEAGNYLMHDPDCKIVFSKHEWHGLDKYEFEYVVEERKKEVKPDVDIEQRRPDLNHIPLTRCNIVPTLLRLDKIRKRPKRSFREALEELLSTTRYRLSRELLREKCPIELIEEYELGIHSSKKRMLDRWIEPYYIKPDPLPKIRKDFFDAGKKKDGSNETQGVLSTEQKDENCERGEACPMDTENGCK